MISSSGRNKNTVGRMYEELTRATLAASYQEKRWQFGHFDEVHFGTKKYYYGADTRTKGYWFLTGTQVCIRNGATGPEYCAGETAFEYCEKRTKDAVGAFVRKHTMQQGGSYAWTDSAKCYNDVKEFAHHDKVNHSNEWATEAGVNINIAEATHMNVRKTTNELANRAGQSLLETLVSSGCDHGSGPHVVRKQDCRPHGAGGDKILYKNSR